MPREDGALAGAGDALLLERVAAGDRAAFERLLARHQAALWRFVRASSRTRQDAEDALQDALLAAYRGAGAFRGEASVRTWLLTIGRHAAWRVSRRAPEEPLDDDTWELGCAAGWGADDPETAAMAAQDRARLTAALDGLAPGEREVLVLRDLEELAVEEVAEVLGVSLAATKSRLHRARLRLAAALRGPLGARHA